RAAAVFDALKESGLNFVCIYPNNDHGCEGIFDGLAEVSRLNRFRVIPSMRFEYFLSLLRGARAIVGNSSAGIREAPVYGVPTVNLGSRQLNRFHYSSIINVPETTKDTLEALRNLPETSVPTFYFGRGDSAQRFAQALCGKDLWQTPRQKQFRDIEHLEAAPFGDDYLNG
ncbi:MAG TPA: UDP-N-acetylglucosamine 2-epimerase, partial [Gemmatimonadaceae bacterium]|nr:UDP-N-acetylglucosamine 2-epimerase [Gemmatimonadaceae bacterium]